MSDLVKIMPNKKEQLVTIALCTYNGERFLSEQLDSIIKQTYKNLEIILVDDGSADKTLEIAYAYQQADSRIKVHKNHKNLGFVKNFERAISLAQGEFIALADQDDIWKLDKIDILVKNISDKSLIYTDAFILDKESNINENRTFHQGRYLIEGKEPLSMLFYQCVSGNTLLFNKKLKEVALPFPENIRFHDIWLAFCASCTDGIKLYSKPLIYYRRHADQVTNKNKKKAKGLKHYLDYNKTKYNALIGNISHWAEVFINSGKMQAKDVKLAKLILQHSKNFNKGFFNIKLFFQMAKINNILFFYKKQRGYLQSLKFAMKAKGHKYTFYLF